jgi:hypothetical protein
MTQILARAIVDVVREPGPVGMGMFRVEVWGEEPHDYVRHYDIAAKSDTMAAQEGLKRFVEDIEQLLFVSDED